METALPLQIRRATASDSVLLAEIGAETFADTFAAENTPENMAAYLSAAFSAAQQARELADPASRFLIAAVAGLAAGYARLRFGPAPAAVAGEKLMEIARFYVRKPWIGKGAAAQLMQACMSEAQRAECDVAWLDVWERNFRAIAFYRKWGFAEVGVQAFQLGDDLQRDLLMARAVKRDAGGAVR